MALESLWLMRRGILQTLRRRLNSLSSCRRPHQSVQKIPWVPSCRRAKKLTEYEKWEYKQLMMSGVLDVREFPLFDEENGMGVLAQVDEVCACCRVHTMHIMW